MAGKSKKNLAVFVSGGGSNLQSVIDACESGELNAEVKIVISSRDGVYALERAEKHGIPFSVFKLSDYSSREERDGAISERLKNLDINFIVLAGYLGILTPALVKEYERKIINIHPALLPSYGGANYHGIHVHKAVIAAGEPLSGATVHYVDEGTDTGEIIMQESIAVESGETPESLQEKILNKIEHKLLVKALMKLCN